MSQYIDKAQREIESAITKQCSLLRSEMLRANTVWSDDIRKSLNRTIKKLESRTLQSHNLLLKIQEISDNICKQVECFDETILAIYTNIKRNQFLYANYPDEWNETFLEIKDRLKKENESFKE